MVLASARWLPFENGFGGGIRFIVGACAVLFHIAFRHPAATWGSIHGGLTAVAHRKGQLDVPSLANIKTKLLSSARWLPGHAGFHAGTRKASTITVQVTAQSLYEAVAQALRVFREDDRSEDPNHRPASVVVTTNRPQVKHRVRIKDFENWLESAGKSPAEMALKSRFAGHHRTLASAILTPFDRVARFWPADISPLASLKTKCV